MNASKSSLILSWLGLIALAGCAEGGEDIRERTEAGCAGGACECVFTSECPGALLCVDGRCEPASVLPDTVADVDVADGDVEPPGLLGEFCVTNTDCASGYCLETAVGGYCTHQCVDGCPQDWVCKSVASATDPVSLCAQDTSRLCLPCEEDRGCGGDQRDKCLDIGGGRFCGRDCGVDGCPEGYVCTEIDRSAETVRQCVPENGTCDCTLASAGLQKTCTSTNEHGTCFGVATCDPADGFVGCTARAPEAEACNGRDDDCDGSTDEGEEPAECVRESELGRCVGTETCQGAAGRVCSALEPAAEACNDRDDDCDGATDEDFRLGGETPRTVAHCGACGVDCAARYAHADEVACEVGAGGAACVLVSCEQGYILLGGACVDENATLCTPCGTDGDCFGLRSRCLALTETDPRTFCARDCSGEAETTTTCPEGYACEAALEQCLPLTASCDCTAMNAGQEKACTRSNARGTCYGLETCDAARGWIGCTAPEPVPELCNGRDDDCDGAVDEDLALGQGCEVQNPFGLCQGVTLCAGALGLRCSALVPAAEACNGRDDDCDGTTDEGFGRDLGGAVKYDLSPDHCGACGYACPAIAHGEARCDGAGAIPRCVVMRCEPGYYPGPGGLTCVPVPRQNQCAPCTRDADCQGPGDRCVLEGATGYCARDCAAGAIYGTAASPCSGEPGVQGCCPEAAVCTVVGEARVCRPRSGTCLCTEEGATVACQVSNTFGTCLGARVCDLDAGLGACTAATPSIELCNDRDDDCDGRLDAADDSLVATSTPTGTVRCGDGPGCVGTWACVEGGWQCSARPASGEVCDTVDNDCDGGIDEDFRDAQGRYVSRAHCGGCGLDCAALVANATATECALVGGVATCRATACAPGTYAFDGGRACLPLPDNLCAACEDDADCLVPGSRCLGSGADRACARSCAAGSPYGATCPAGYLCAGGAEPLCLPRSGSCQCGPGDEGVTRACAVGACVGLQTCEESAGAFAFTACSAEGLVPEVCDGADNDCDGTVDEGFRGASGAYDTAAACGSCANNCLARFGPEQHAIGACGGAGCVVGGCTREVVAGVSYEYVDTNGAASDGCECRRVEGTTADEPDLDLGPARPAAGATYVDADCDGVDGRVADSIFVRAGAAAPGAGTLASPFPTIGQALAAVGTRRTILVAGGDYREDIVLAADVALHGGYAPDFRSRDIVAFETRLLGVEPDWATTPLPGTVHAANLRSGRTVVSGFTIRGYDVAERVSAGGGHVSYAVYALDCDAALVLRNNLVLGGAGGAGGDGASGANGFGRDAQGGAVLDGGAGESVESGAEACTGTTCSGGARAGGAAGANPQCAEASGIAGGAATCPSYGQPSWTPPVPGKDGAPGYHWTRDSQTADASCTTHLTEAGYPTDIKKLDGLDGLDGVEGGEGLQGLGCVDELGLASGGQWASAAGATGVAGVAGARGGAGAPSGGVDTAPAGLMPAGVGAAATYRHKLGAGGGGAGAGGCGGAGGSGGGSGGASIAVFVGWLGATPASAPVLVANVIERGPGGPGGTGGYGGTGGAGGNGGAGGGSRNFWVGFRAGNGGRGGNGGEGGGGGGGCGGPSLGVAIANKPVGLVVDYLPGNAFPLADSVATGGEGGEGGPSGAARTGARGRDGASRNQLVR